MSNAEKFAKAFEPVIKHAADANLLSNALLRHYVGTISELTGKEPEEIRKEIDQHLQDYKKEVLDENNPEQ